MVNVPLGLVICGFTNVRTADTLSAIVATTTLIANPLKRVLIAMQVIVLAMCIKLVPYVVQDTMKEHVVAVDMSLIPVLTLALVEGKAAAEAAKQRRYGRVLSAD